MSIQGKVVKQKVKVVQAAQELAAAATIAVPTSAAVDEYKHPAGLYPKYEVKRIDGKDTSDSDLFVLDIANDKHAQAAILAYAVSCASENPVLAASLLVKYNEC